VSLPTYGFDRASFWLTKTDEATLVLPQEWHYRQTVSPQDAMIRNHIITGKPMLPGAGMIQFGLEALQQALNQPVNTLQNIVFKNPGIIETDTDIEVEIHPKENKFILKTDTQELCEGEYVI